MVLVFLCVVIVFLITIKKKTCVFLCEGLRRVLLNKNCEIGNGVHFDSCERGLTTQTNSMSMQDCVSNPKSLIIFCVVILVEWLMGVCGLVMWLQGNKCTMKQPTMKIYVSYCHFAMLLWIVFFSFCKRKRAWRNIFMTPPQHWVQRSFPRYGARLGNHLFLGPYFGKVPTMEFHPTHKYKFMIWCLI